MGVFMFAHPLRFVRHAGALPRLCLLALLLLLSGCAGFSSDQGMDAVSGMTKSSLDMPASALSTDEDIAAARRTVAALLKRPLGLDASVRIALLNNRDLQAAYNELGIAEAERVRASLPPNPRVDISRIAGSGAFEFEARIIANILSLATLPARADLATDRFRQAQLRAVEATLRTAFETRRAYVEAVANRQLVEFLAQAQSSAEAAVELAKRLGESGTMTKLDQARNQVFYAEMAARLAKARQRAAGSRERLVRAVGLSGGDLAFRLPASLPALPSRALTEKSIEIEAIRRRTDLQIARLEVVALEKKYGLTKATRFINLLEVSGVERRLREPGGDSATERGVGVEFEVPLFDFGEVSLREAEAAYNLAVNRLAAKAVNAGSDAREAYQQYRSAFDVARRYQRDVLPLRKMISEETLLRYNAMQIDVFALLAESRERIASSISAIESQRDFWLADTNLSSAILGGGRGGAAEASDNAGSATASAEPPNH
jgi:outer membrane protein TolC